MTYADDIAKLCKAPIDKYVTDLVTPLQTKIATSSVEIARLTDENSVKSAQVISLTTQLQQAQAEITRLTNLLNQTYDVQVGGNIQSVLSSKAEGATIKIAPGEYRLISPLVFKKDQKLIGAGSDKTTLKGSVVLEGFTKEGEAWVKAGVLPAAYTDAGQCEINSGTDANPCQKREDVFVDGKRLDRVMQLASLKTGTYFADYASNKLYLFDTPSRVEICRTQYALNTKTTGGRISGLRIQHFASPSQTGAVVIGAGGWEVDNCYFDGNHASGLHLAESHNTKVHHNVFAENGQAGMTHYKSNATSITYNKFMLNNTAGYYKRDWESAGFKATYSAQTVFSYNTVVDNAGVGVWFDIDNTDYLITDNLVSDNFSCGIRVEISFSGEIARNTITRNGLGHAGPGRGSDYSGFATAGIHVNSAGGMGLNELKIHDNLVGVTQIGAQFVALGYQNQNAIHIEQRDRGVSKTYPLLTWTARNVKVYNNKVNVTKVANKEGTGVVGLGVLGATASQVFLPASGNTFENNEYFNTNLTDVQFHCMDGTTTNRYRAFARWQQLGYDKTGKLTQYVAV